MGKSPTYIFTDPGKDAPSDPAKNPPDFLQRATMYLAFGQKLLKSVAAVAFIVLIGIWISQCTVSLTHTVETASTKTVTVTVPSEYGAQSVELTDEESVDNIGKWIWKVPMYGVWPAGNQQPELPNDVVLYVKDVVGRGTISANQSTQFASDWRGTKDVPRDSVTDQIYKDYNGKEILPGSLICVLVNPQNPSPRLASAHGVYLVGPDTEIPIRVKSRLVFIIFRSPAGGEDPENWGLGDDGTGIFRPGGCMLITLLQRKTMNTKVDPPEPSKRMKAPAIMPSNLIPLYTKTVPR